MALQDDVTLVKGVPRDRWSCEEFPVLLPVPVVNQSIYMVVECPEKHPMSKLCARTVDSGYHYTMDLPVLSTTSGVWYQNMYCASCYGDETHLGRLDLRLECSSVNITLEKVLSDGEYLPRSLGWRLPGDDNCTLSASLIQESESTTAEFLNSTSGGTDPPFMGWVRPCPPHVDSCAADWTNKTVEQYCKTYALFMTSNSTVYKNPYCAMCNMVPLKDLKCPNFGKRTSLRKDLPSLTLIMNVNWDLTASSSCRFPQSIWDILHQRCVPLEKVCAAHYEFQEGKCVPVQHEPSSNTSCLDNNIDSCWIESESNSSDHVGSFNLSCVVYNLSKDEFYLLANGSLVLNMSHNTKFSGMVLSSKQFSVQKDGTAVVCKDIFTEVIFSGKLPGYLTVISISISVICLILHIATYYTLPKLRNLPGKNLLSLSWALLLAQLIFLIGVEPSFDVPHYLCVGIAAFIHFFFLVAFFWMNVMSIDIFRTFSTSVGRSTSSWIYLKYASYAWGTPLLIVILALTVDVSHVLPSEIQPKYASQNGVCWIGSEIGMIVFFTIPAAIMLLVNVVLFASTVFKIDLQTRESSHYIHNKTKAELTASLSRSSSKYVEVKPRKKLKVSSGICGRKDQTRFYLYVKLFIIMGVTWICGIVASLAKIPVLMYPFIVMNGLQGAFIFIMFDLKKKIVAMLWERVLGRRYKLPAFLDVQIKRGKERSSQSENNNTNSSLFMKKLSTQRSSTTSTTFLTTGSFQPRSRNSQGHSNSRKVSLRDQSPHHQDDVIMETSEISLKSHDGTNSGDSETESRPLECDALINNRTLLQNKKQGLDGSVVCRVRCNSGLQNPLAS